MPNSPAAFIADEIVMSKIHLIRGQKVMIDRDLAELYGVQTRVFKQAVRRNINRFPGDFMFELLPAEWDSLRSQIVTLRQDAGNIPNTCHSPLRSRVWLCYQVY